MSSAPVSRRKFNAIHRSGTRPIATRPALPALLCPYESQASPHRAWVERENLAWLQHVGLVRGERASERARRAMFGVLAARAYPTASEEGLSVAAAWASWLFLRDDVCDDRPGAALEVSERNQGQLDVLSGHAEPNRKDPFQVSLADLRRRMVRLGGSAWISRFLGNVKDYFDACAWEASNRARGVVPDLDTYVHMRDLTGAVRTCFDIYELVDGGPLPVEVRNNPAVRQILTLGNRMICWSNDIFSADKERAHGDFHNLVLILEHAGTTREGAIAAASRMHDDLVEELARNEAKLANASELTRAAAPIVRATKGWVRANLDWSIETGRYVGNDWAPVAPP